MADVIDELLAQWRRQRPDLDFAPMGTIGRLHRFIALSSKAIDTTLDQHGLSVADFDVLAALRRIGEPYIATPTLLTRSVMLSPAGMTARLDRLERAGYVERTGNPDDRRSFLVELTEAGRERVDAAVADHVATEERLLSALTDRQRKALDDALRILNEQFE
jgi:DNA-binding MarR family transcriptional regulator